MNKITFDGKEIKNIEQIKGFNLTVKGDNNEIILNSFEGDATVWVYVEGDNNTFSFGTGNTVKNDFAVNFWPANAQKPENIEFTIGNNNFFNGSGNSFIAPLFTNLHIGDSNLFAGSITIWGRNDHIIYDVKTKSRINNDRDIVIGSNNWICQSVTFLPGAVISNNSVVGYGSLVNKCFNKNNILIAGIPAKIKRKNINWSRATNYESIDFNDNLKVINERNDINE